MTIEELYKWAVKNDVEDYDIVVMGLSGATYDVDPAINVKYKEVEL